MRPTFYFYCIYIVKDGEFSNGKGFYHFYRSFQQLVHEFTLFFDRKTEMICGYGGKSCIMDGEWEYAVILYSLIS